MAVYGGILAVVGALIGLGGCLAAVEHPAIAVTAPLIVGAVLHVGGLTIVAVCRVADALGRIAPKIPEAEPMLRPEPAPRASTRRCPRCRATREVGISACPECGLPFGGVQADPPT